MNKCDSCGRFISNVTAWIRESDDSIHQVQGQCSKHGTIDVTDWEADQFDSGYQPVSKD